MMGFPEEVLIRGLILNETKIVQIYSIIIYPTIIICNYWWVAHIISNLIHLGNPELLSVVGLMIQFYIFGITLQLYREFAGSLWANMLFHLVCLETVRFVL